MEKAKRIAEFDFFKGIAIFLVVVGHVILNNVEGALDSHPVYTWIYSFHMPLFFFISGFLIHHTLGNRSIGTCIKKKFLSLLVPYFVWCFVVAPFVNGESLPTLLYVIAETDGRYWFVYLLFLFSVFYYVGQLKQRNVRGVLGGALLSLLVFVIVQLIYPCEVTSRGLQFLPFFVLGVISSAFDLKEKAAIFRDPLPSLATVLFLATSLRYCQIDIPLMSKALKFLASFSFCYLMLFYINGRFLYEENRIVKMIAYTGKNTIVIYLTHFFMVKLLPFPIAENLSPYPFWVFVLGVLVAMIIIPACLLLGKLAERFKWINRIVYGRY